MDGRAAAVLDMSPARAFKTRVGGAQDTRLSDALVLLVETLTKLIAQSNATRDDLRAVISFLTEVGESCDDQRQEWVLLADTLGLTSAVENNAARRPEGSTPNTMPGPFYRTGAPLRKSGDSISLDGAGTALAFKAEVTDLDGGAVVGAAIEIWQANGEGLYENQDPDRQPEFNLRGLYRSGIDGTVSIRTVRPAGYSVPGDGPVGKLMKRLGISLQRPAHLHFRISAPGFQTLTTHVFDASDPAINRDPLFAVHPALLTTFEPQAEGGFGTAFRFVLARARPGAQAV